MLKLLRKYKTWILVVFGIMLMIAFLLPQTIQELATRRPGEATMRMAGRKISMPAAMKASQEYNALRILTNDTLAAVGGPENTDHWVMLVHEAERAGLIGGAEDGRLFTKQLAERIVATLDPFRDEQRFREGVENFSRFMEQNRQRVMGDTRLGERDLNLALAKLRGVFRLRDGYLGAPRLSDRRLVKEVKRLADEATIDYMFIPGEREVLGQPNPDEKAVLAQYEKFREVKPGEGANGIGYYQPDRITLTWLTFNRNAVARSITLDPVEVQKRFLRANPTGQPPAGMTMEQARADIEREVRTEQTDAVLKAAEQALRAEFDRVLRKLPTEGDFRVLPSAAEWEEQRPDFNQLSVTLVQRVRELKGVSMPVPGVDLRRGAFMGREEVERLPGIGSSFMRRGAQSVPFAELAFRVKEIVGTNELALQAGIPSREPALDFEGNRYYFMVMDARKASPPLDIAEVRNEVARDISRLAGFAKLEGVVEERRSAVVGKGFEALNENVAVPQAGDNRIQLNTRLPVQQAVVTRSAVRPAGPNAGAEGDPRINHEETRRAIMEFTGKLDPTVDPATLPADQRTFAVLVPKGLGMLVGQVKTLGPLTQERFRTMQTGMARQVLSGELKLDNRDNDPFSLKNMEKRLDVEYLDGRTRRADEPAGEAPAAS
jgi:hypothetical protein